MTITPLRLLGAAATEVSPEALRVDPERRTQWPVVLVSMPFMDIDWPSIQLGLLGAILRRHGFPVETLHANLDFAAQIGPAYYRQLGVRKARLVAEWLFSVEAFGPDAPDRDDRLLDDFAAELGQLGEGELGWRDRLLRARYEDVPAYLDKLAADPMWDGVRVVGFTSTFQQNTPSFALARRLKERDPALITVFGGANFDGEMGPEWVRSVASVDFAVVGEADTAFPRLLDRLVVGAPPAEEPGVACGFGDELTVAPQAAPLRQMDDLPAPDYTEYFERAGRLNLLPLAGPSTVRIPFESSRGCWWGEKHHCTFCGLNGSTMKFRAKSPERMTAELVSQARRYRSFQFHGVDNIVDMAYLKELFPVLAAEGVNYEIFYEVKANLTREQVRTMAHGGVTHIQPGIESLNSRVLRLMRKGVRAAQNINLLRWAGYYGIQVGWNLIWGFPGETGQDYAEQAAVLPHLLHLQPPTSAGRVWIERFSPLFGQSPTKTPETTYRYVYPASVDLGKAAYFFEYDLPDALPDSAYRSLLTEFTAWSDAWSRPQRPALTYWSSPGLVQIYDTRHDGAEGTYTFEGPLADLYAACSDRPVTASAARDRIGASLTTPQVQEAFEEFAQRGLMVLDDSLALTLALPAGVPR
jgi:ribosomal peptide maturation radical SAM protein 1